MNPAEVGRRFFILGNQGTGDGWNPIVDVSGVTNLTVSNIHGYASGGFAGGRDSRGTIRFENVYCGPPPGSNRLGFYSGHQGYTRANIVMTNCTWVMSSDDDINELTVLEHVLDHPRPDTITVFNSDDYQVGDTVSIWDYSDLEKVYSAA